MTLVSAKRSLRAVDGVLLLDKPVGITSQAAVTRVKRLFSAAKAGHTGTLDPMASGLLPVCLGEATKFSHLLIDADKEYRAVVRLGLTTTTGDLEGTRLRAWRDSFVVVGSFGGLDRERIGSRAARLESPAARARRMGAGTRPRGSSREDRGTRSRPKPERQRAIRTPRGAAAIG